MMIPAEKDLFVASATKMTTVAKISQIFKKCCIFTKAALTIEANKGLIVTLLGFSGWLLMKVRL
ncbi:MAG TPA: hypothetical protein PLK85_06145 [Alphaproteobacteria bacterium]|nr:hypothetical protein [Alphaproteobacteria bacterium]